MKGQKKRRSIIQNSCSALCSAIKLFNERRGKYKRRSKVCKFDRQIYNFLQNSCHRKSGERNSQSLIELLLLESLDEISRLC